MRDRPAAGADRVHVDHRHLQRETGNRSGTRIGLRVLAVDHDADVGTGAADVERDQALAVHQGAHPGAAQHAGGQPRQQRERRLFGDHLRRGNAAVGRHDAQLAGHARRSQPAFQVRDVAVDLRPDEGGQRGGGEALELTELRRDEGRRGDERLRHHLPDERLGAQLVRRVEVGEQKTDRHRLDAFVAQFLRGSQHCRLIQRHQFGAGRWRQAPGHGLAVAALHQRPALPRQVLLDRIVLDALVAANVQDVAKAVVGDHAGTRALVFQDGVGGGGGAVEDVVDLRGKDAAGLAQLANAGHHADRRILRRCGHLVDRQIATVHVAEHQIGEGSTDVHTDRLHASLHVTEHPPARPERLRTAPRTVKQGACRLRTETRSCKTPRWAPHGTLRHPTPRQNSRAFEPRSGCHNDAGDQWLTSRRVQSRNSAGSSPGRCSSAQCCEPKIAGRWLLPLQ